MTIEQAVRAEVSLDGAWEFRHESHAAWRSVTVPNPWQATCADLRDTAGRATYRRGFAIPAGWRDREVAIRFGAVSDLCTVAVNGRELVRHEGGYLPFEVVLPPDLCRADNDLVVTATLPTSEAERYPEGPFTEIPHGKQSWYGPLAGIWQSVVLEARHPRHIAHCAIVADRTSGRVDAAVTLSLAAPGGRVRLRVREAGGAAVVAEGTVEAPGPDLRATLTVADARPWSPDDPVLYELAAELVEGDTVLDRRIERFGFRSIEARDGKLLLNGAPFYLRGALDQDYYPEGICTPPSLAFLEDQLLKAKHLGLNCLRCHIKVPDPRYYEVADRLGMLVWTEIPNVERFTDASARRLRDTFEGILRRDGNHPSIVIWTIVNEDWGTRLVENPDHRAWLGETFDWVKALDPTRLVVDNSPCHTNFHVKTDINDYHYYRSLPERREEWDELTAEFAAGADWTFTPHRDGTRTGREPLVLSEFGVWGLPRPDKLRGPDGREPWWMEYGAFWGDGAAYPHGVETRFAALRLDRVFGSFEAFVEAAQWQQFRNLRYQIESVRSHPSIVGYVITELTDVHWEANGLLDLERNPRVFHDRFAAVNAETVIVARPERRAFWAGETASIEVTVAAGGQALPEGTALTWTIGAQSGRVAVPAVPPMSTSGLARIAFAVPAAAPPQQAELRLTLAAGTGPVMASAAVDLSFYRPIEGAGSIKVSTRDPELGSYLALLGYDLVDDGADVVVARGVDAADVDAIRRGGRVLVLADTHTSRRNLRLDEMPREHPFLRVVDGRAGLPAANHHHFPGLTLVQRQDTMWRGDWISSFGWLRRHGPFAALPGGPLLDLSFDRVVPRAVLTGFQPWEYESRVHAGVVVGWVHKPAATVGERFFGAGKLTATTFRLLRDRPGADPVAATLLHALLLQAMA